MPKKFCLNDNTKTYTGTENTPLGLGYSAEGCDEGTILIGRDNLNYICVQTKSSKKWYKHSDKDLNIELNDIKNEEFYKKEKCIEEMSFKNIKNTKIKKNSIMNEKNNNKKYNKKDNNKIIKETIIPEIEESFITNNKIIKETIIPEIEESFITNNDIIKDEIYKSELYNTPLININNIIDDIKLNINEPKDDESEIYDEQYDEESYEPEIYDDGSYELYEVYEKREIYEIEYNNDDQSNPLKIIKDKENIIANNIKERIPFKTRMQLKEYNQDTDNIIDIKEIMKNISNEEIQDNIELEDNNIPNDLPREYYLLTHIPQLQKLVKECGKEQKLGGDYPFFIKGESWPIDLQNNQMRFLGQFKDPRHKGYNNKLIRIFYSSNYKDMINSQDILIDDIELNRENIKNQIMIKNPYSNTGYYIESWYVNIEFVEYPLFKEKFNISLKKYLDHSMAPTNQFKVGGTSYYVNDKKIALKDYNFFLQFSNYSIFQHNKNEYNLIIL
jgi:hypothetical protein